MTLHGSFRRTLVLCSLASLPLLAQTLLAQTSVTTAHNDIGRTGQNTTETILTQSNVNTTSFGKLFTLAVDGQVYAQPLYLPSVTIGGAAHRVVFAATEHDSVYAFDAATGSQLWKASLLDTAHGAASGATTDPQSDTGCGDISALNGSSEYGITGTPVIDPSTGTLYVVSKTLEGSYPVQRLHALDITSGAEKLGGPVVLKASVSGSGSGSSGGVLSFDAKWENQRPGLLLLNGNVYIGFASHCDDSPWHGWLLGYNAATLAQTAVFVSTPNGSASGIWMSGAGIAADVQNSVGRLFPVTGNGTYDSKSDYGDDILRLTQSSTGALSVADSFTPYNQAAYNNADEDVASGGALLLPDQAGANPHLLVQLGKSTSMYVVNRDSMGGYSTSTNNIVQTVTTTNGLWGMPAYWNGNVYIWPSEGKLSRYPITNGVLSATPAETSTQSQSAWLGSTPSISSNGAANGIVWSLDWSQTPGVLYAHNATNVSQLLWASSQNTTRDSVGTPVKFVVPTIADGNVFVGADNQLDIYGLVGAPVPDFSLSSFPAALAVQPGGTATGTITLTPINGFTGSPSFNVTGLPAGVTAAVSTGVLNLYTVTVTADSSAAVATASATITATSGSLTHTLPLTVAVSTAPPSTALNMSSAFNVYGVFNTGSTVTNGGLDTGSTAYSANLLGTNLLAENVYFTFGAPNGANAAANTVIPLASGSFSTLDLLGSAVNGNQASQSFVVTYTDGTTSTFTQSLSDWFTPQSYTGETIASAMAYRVSSNGTTDNRTFNLYAYTFALNSAKTVKSLTLPANRNVVILAAALTGSAAPGFSLAASSPTVSLAQSASVTDTITQTSFGGFTGTATLSASGLPSGLTASFASGTAAGASVVTFTAASSAAAGTYPVVITGTSGSLTSSVTVNVTINPPASFTLSDTATLAISQGSTAADTITVVPAGGFSGSVTLAATGLPSGVTASFATNPATSSSVLTLTASSGAATGTSTVTITGTSGSLTASTTISLTVNAASPAVQVSLASAFNVSYGIATNGRIFGFRAGLDGQGYAYSATLLGTSVTAGGTTFTLGAANANNAVYSSTITLPAGKHNTLSLLATAVNGNQANQSFVVTYTDNTTATFTQSLSDWYTPQSYSGESKAVTMAYRDYWTGAADNRTFYLYSYTFTLNSSKTVKSIKLPGNRNVTVLAITMK